MRRPAGNGLALRIKKIPAALSFTRTAGIFIFGTRDAWRKAGDEALVYLQSGTLRMMQTA